MNMLTGEPENIVRNPPPEKIKLSMNKKIAMI